jgi:hypothetical protein
MTGKPRVDGGNNVDWGKTSADYSAWRSGLAVVMVIALPTLLLGQADLQWIENKGQQYSVFYQAGYESDAAFAQTWLIRTQGLIQTKYRVTLDRYYISMYLYPAPNARVDTVNASFRPGVNFVSLFRHFNPLSDIMILDARHRKICHALCHASSLPREI